MTGKWLSGRIAALALVVLLGAFVASASGGVRDPKPANVTIYASGLLNPRGLTFGPGGELYVAEGGSGGTTATTDAQCTQVPGPPLHPTGPGPIKGGFTARISAIDRLGIRRTVVDGLPSAVSTIGASVQGVADVKFFHGALYAITAGAGCSHGLLGTHNSLLRVDHDGSTSDVVNLSAFLQANPIADNTYEREDFEPDGTWYSMVKAWGALYAVEPNHQEIDRISNGHVTRVLDMSAQSVDAGEWIGPTSIVRHGGALYFGTLSPFPIQTGHSKIYKLTKQGKLSVAASDLTTVLGVAFCAGHMYALESMTDTNPGFPTPNQIGSGKVVRVEHDGSQTVVVGGLSFPTAMTFGPDGALYISNFGFSSPTGEIVRAELGGKKGGCG